MFNAKREFGHHNIIMYSMKNGYWLWDLLKKTFNSVITLLVIKQALGDGGSLNVKIGEMSMSIYIWI